MDFQSSVEETSPIAKKIKVTVPAAEISKKFGVELDKYSNQAKLKGFRPGKAPKDMIKRVYGEQVRAQVTQDVISQVLRDAAKKHDINIVGSPNLTLESTGEDKPLEFVADVACYPKPEVKGYEKLKIEVPKKEVTEQDIQAVVDYLLKSRATLKPLEGRKTLAKNDVAQVEVSVFEEGSEPNKPEPYSFCLGEKQLPEEVEGKIEGMAIDETRDAVVARENKEEKPLVYRLTLKTLSERILPELNDTFASEVEPEVKTVAELKTKIRERLEKEKEEERIADQNGAIIEKLVELHQFDVPQALIDEEMLNLLERRGMIDPSKIDVNNFPWEVLRKDLGEGAAKRVRAAIVVDRIAEKEGIKLEKEDVDAAVATTAAQYRVPVAEAQRQLLSKERGMSFMVETMRNKVLAHLREKAQITSK